ncbi:MAG: hypothetical protein ACOCM4_11785 [Acetivibrio ethanolgignens]
MGELIWIGGTAIGAFIGYFLAEMVFHFFFGEKIDGIKGTPDEDDAEKHTDK